MKKELSILVISLITIAFLPSFVMAETHYPMNDDIFVDLNGISPDWVYYEDFIWEDPSLLGRRNTPNDSIYEPFDNMPPIANRTPSGIWNLTLSLNMTSGSGQYNGYMACENNDSLTIDLFGGEVQYYSETGPFNITIDTAYWGTGWMRFVFHAVIDDPWLVSSERWLTYWFYIDTSLVPSNPVTSDLVQREPSEVITTVFGSYGAWVVVL